jgi:predicted DCC family thiol-disulfide oxidoreductase YuxK
MTTTPGPSHPYLIYDADCGFCTRTANWLAARGTVAIRPWQAVADLGELGLDEQLVTEAAYWVEDGRPAGRGAVAIGRALIARGGVSWPLGRLILSRPVAPLAARIYALVARYRFALPGGTGACRLPQGRP